MKILHVYLDMMEKIQRNSIEGIIILIRLYQKTFSPDHGLVRTHSTRHCRFFPSCSDYAIESLRQYGLARGIMLSLKRIGRCNPFCTGGYDPVANI